MKEQGMGRALFFYGIAGLASGSLFASVIDMTIQSPADTERRIQLSNQSGAMATLLRRIQSEYREMPGLKLTEAQARRLWDIAAARAAAF